jgi:hypothetical protein
MHLQSTAMKLAMKLIFLPDDLVANLLAPPHQTIAP